MDLLGKFALLRNKEQALLYQLQTTFGRLCIVGFYL